MKKECFSHVFSELMYHIFFISILEQFSKQGKMIKLIFIFLISYALYFLVNYVDSLSIMIGYLGYITLFSWISWQTGSFLFKVVTEKLVPPVNPEKKAIFITGEYFAITQVSCDRELVDLHISFFIVLRLFLLPYRM